MGGLVEIVRIPFHGFFHDWVRMHSSGGDGFEIGLGLGHLGQVIFGRIDCDDPVVEKFSWGVGESDETSKGKEGVRRSMGGAGGE